MFRAIRRSGPFVVAVACALAVGAAALVLLRREPPDAAVSPEGVENPARVGATRLKAGLRTGHRTRASPSGVPASTGPFDGSDASSRSASEPRPSVRLTVRVVAQESEVPIDGAAVVVTGGDGTRHEDVTDATGVAAFAAVVSPDEGQVDVAAPGFVRKCFHGAELEEGGGFGCTVELERGIAVPGVVLDLDGRPVPGARIIALLLRNWIFRGRGLRGG